MYVGESVTFSCGVDVPSSWEYLWFKDGAQLTSDSSKSDYTISSPAPSDGGLYTCKARRGKHELFAEESRNVSLNIVGKIFLIILKNTSCELCYRWNKDIAI